MDKGLVAIIIALISIVPSVFIFIINLKKTKKELKLKEKKELLNKRIQEEYPRSDKEATKEKSDVDIQIAENYLQWAREFRIEKERIREEKNDLQDQIIELRKENKREIEELRQYYESRLQDAEKEVAEMREDNTRLKNENARLSDIIKEQQERIERLERSNGSSTNGKE